MVREKSRSKLFSGSETLICEKCGKDLLEKPTGNIVLVGHIENSVKKVEYIYVCCKGCSKHLKETYKNDLGWEDIEDMTIPKKYLQKYMAIINNIYSGRYIFSEKAFDIIKTILLKIAPCVFREITEDETKRMAELSGIPEGL